MERFEDFNFGEYDYVADEENIAEEYEIKNASEADWAIEKIIEERHRRDCFIETAKAKIDKLKAQIEKETKRCDNATNFLTSKLAHYVEHSDVPTKKTKTQESLNLPSGKVVIKFPKAKIVMAKDGTDVSKAKENKDFVNEVEGIDAKYIKTVKSVDWAKLKKDLTIDESSGIITVKDTGECLDTLGVEIGVKSVEIKEG
jgi:hypothetical protein